MNLHPLYGPLSPLRPSDYETCFVLTVSRHDDDVSLFREIAKQAKRPLLFRDLAIRILRNRFVKNPRWGYLLSSPAHLEPVIIGLNAVHNI